MDYDYIRRVFPSAGITLAYDEARARLQALGADGQRSIAAAIEWGFLEVTNGPDGSVYLTSTR